MTAPIKVEAPLDIGDLLTTRFAAKRMGVSLRTVQLWCEAGLLRAFVTPGGHRRIPSVDVAGLMKKADADGKRIDLSIDRRPARPATFDSRVVAAAEQFVSAVEAVNSSVAKQQCQVPGAVT